MSLNLLYAHWETGVWLKFRIIIIWNKYSNTKPMETANAVCLSNISIYCNYLSVYLLQSNLAVTHPSDPIEIKVILRHRKTNILALSNRKL